jgi:hypothetical protein
MMEAIGTVMTHSCAVSCFAQAEKRPQQQVSFFLACVAAALQPAHDQGAQVRYGTQGEQRQCQVIDMLVLQTNSAANCC